MRRLKSGDISEASIHIAVLEWASINPAIKPYRPFIIHYPNEGKRTLIFGKRLKQMGMRKGISDLFIAFPKHGFGGAWIELKSANGKLTPEQKQFLDDMKLQNFYTKVCWSFDDAVKEITWYLTDCT